MEIDKIAEGLGIKRNKGETDENLHWRVGYAQGMKEGERINNKALNIGRAIMNVMYETFETAKEDY